MADYYNLDDDDEGGFGEGIEQVSSRSQIVAFVISVECFCKDERTFTAARDVVLGRVLELGLASSTNKVGVILYGTSNEKSASEEALDNVYCFHDVASPTTELVTELASLTLEDMRDVCGDPIAPRSEAYVSGLSNAAIMVHKQVTAAKGKTKAIPVVVFVTGDPTPADSFPGVRDQIVESMQRTQQDAFVMVAPISEKGVFSNEPTHFWNTIQKLLDNPVAAAAGLASCSLQTVAQDMAVRWPITKLLLTKSLRFYLTEGISFSCQHLKLAKPATPVATKWLDATSNEEIVSSSALVCMDTGATLGPEDLQTQYFSLEDKKMNETAGLPARVTMPLSAAMDLKGQSGGFGDIFPCLHLLCFKPASSLMYTHQCQAADFIYFDESSVDAETSQRNTSMFLTLWLAMSDSKLIAVCTMKSLYRSAPRSVALSVVQEQLGPDDAQIQPPGLAIHHLPYPDEVRRVTCDPKVLSESTLKKATPAAVNAAGALIDAMTDTTITRFTFSNPEPAFMIDVLKAQISNAASLPNAAEYPDSVEQYLKTQSVNRPVSVGILDAYVDQVMGGSLHDADATMTKKRGPPASTVSDSEIVMHTNWKNLVATDALKRQTANQLKAYCKHHNLATAGLKKVLLDRVDEHVRAQM